MTREEFRNYVDFLRSQDEISYDVYCGLIDGIDTLEQEPKTEKVIKMRDATPEEREAIDRYIKSISKPTGVNIFDFYEDEEQEQIDFVQPKKTIPCTVKIQEQSKTKFWDLDDNDDCISRKAVLSLLADHFDNVFDMVKELPSVAIPSAEPTKDLLIQIIRDILAMYVVDENGNQLSRDEVKCGAINIVKKYLKKLPSAEPKWIPVSERLPKPNECVGNVCRYYLIQNEYGDMMVAMWDGQGWEQMYQYGEYIEDDVTAWMPLPKPYETQESEEI